MGAEATFPVIGEIVKGGEQSGDGAEKWDKLFGSQSPAGQQMTEYQRQKEFAQHGIRWRVEDAIRAGLNPEAVLGTSGASYSPSATFSAGQPSYSDRDRAIDSITAMGQNAYRSIASTMTAEEKTFKRLQLMSLQQDVINKGIQNDILKTRWDQLNGPDFPGSNYNVPGQSNSGSVEIKPQQVTSTDRVFRHAEPHAIADTGWARTSTGLTPVPAKDMKERIEDQFAPEMVWAARNYLDPNKHHKGKPIHLLKKEFPGAIDLEWSTINLEWRPVYPGRKTFKQKVKEWGNKYGF